MDEHTDGPSFRATKRRKVFRKRAESDTDDREPHVATLSQSGQVPPADGAANTAVGDEDTISRPEITRVRKPKKHGIAFSSSDRPSSRPHNDNEETAMVISEPQPAEQQNGRFTRQTGKAVVEDDKHMSAWLDSKMAEIRNASTASNSTSQQPSHPADVQPQAQLSPTSTGRESTPLSPPNPVSGLPAPGLPTTTSTSTKPTRTTTRRHRRPRAPCPSTTARASLIDQILRESNHTPHYTANPNTPAMVLGDAHFDPDAAAAAAFKADFLAQAEARNLSRRHPAINASASSATAAAVPSGPKLGGSRAARERMRAAEEAKGKK